MDKRLYNIQYKYLQLTKTSLVANPRRRNIPENQHCIPFPNILEKEIIVKLLYKHSVLKHIGKFLHAYRLLTVQSLKKDVQRNRYNFYKL